MSKFSILTLTTLVLLGLSCGEGKHHSQIMTSTNKDSKEHRYTNELIHETSPYLLQHAHNPVNWRPWNDETLELAKKENKLLIISIGYAACHWCHVMEKESFEDTAVARIMNENFICIKVDREERPDIDQVYMNAIQLLSGQGGWPLNCFALPNGKPFYGGTYFPKDHWMRLLQGVVDAYTKDSQSIEKDADKLTQAIRQSELIHKNPEDNKFEKSHLKLAVEKWKNYWDLELGGPSRSPKFPIPNNLQYLLRHGYLFKDQPTLDYVELTLNKMAFGGIFDQIGGGFARYSTDEEWKVPHFEKMLYDNAQLVSLYAEAYQFNHNPVFKEVVEKTIEFVERSLLTPENAFCSSLDADSEGEEGKYYVWTSDELKEVLEIEFDLFSEFYEINRKGLWENGNYILLRKELDQKDFQRLGMSENELNDRISELNEKLLKVRLQRVKPPLDDKVLTSWNALMAKAYLDAYEVLGNEHYKKIATSNIEFILNKLGKKDGGLFHNYKSGKSTINGYLEDYCFTIEALIKLYQVTFNEDWLNRAKNFADYGIEHFYDENSGMFFFTSDLDKALIARKMEVNDNVIPASNSSMANSLFLLGNYFENEEYLNTSEQMLKNVYPSIPDYASGYSNWSALLLKRTFPFYEIAICGEDLLKIVNRMNKDYVPNNMVIGSKNDSDLPLMENKFVKHKSIIYVCVNKSCKLPVESWEEAMSQLTY